MRGPQEREDAHSRKKYQMRADWGEVVRKNRQKIADCNKMVELTSKKAILLTLLESQMDDNIDRAMDLITDDNEPMRQSSAAAEHVQK